MKFLSVCSGIDAASVAWKPLGWEAVAFSEIEKFPSAVLAHNYPDTPNLGDMTKYEKWPGTLRPDLVVGGTPCQAFSVAGLRKGLDDPRGNLTLVFLGVLARTRPRWVVWENVPGVLSDKTGAFGAFLGGLGELGYGFAYRVLDAQFFGVPQRRRRVFVVGCLGDWRSAAAVLFEPESLRGDSPPSREAGKIAPTVPARSTGGGGLGTDFDCDGGLIPETANPLTARMHKGVNTTMDEGQTMIAAPLVSSNPYGDQDGRESHLVPTGVTIHGTDKTRKVASFTDLAGSLRTKPPGSQENSSTTAVLAFSCKDHGADAGDQSPTLRSMNQDGSHANGGGQVAIAFDPQGSGKQTTLGASEEFSGALGTTKCPAVAFAQNQREEVRELDVAGALAAEPGAKQQTYLATPVVRRLTPTECERLQGFPDGWTQIPWRGKPAENCPDGPRYKSLGNSMAVPVMRWIGERINYIENSNLKTPITEK